MLKDKGGLFKPSKDVVKICEETEVRFLRMLKISGGKLPQGLDSVFSVYIQWDNKYFNIHSCALG